MRVCESRYLGRTPYAEALALQQSLHDARKRNEAPDTLLLLEHPHVITLGRGANRANILADEQTRAEKSVEMFETGRGGDVTYHGPGQLVGYPIISLAPDRQDVRRYVRDIQEVLVRTARDFGVEAEPRGGEFVGVWVGDEKLAAIGIRISRWVTMHGFAFNVSTNLDYFNLIVPCGIADHGVTSLEKILGEKIALKAVAESVTQHFGDVFQRQMIVNSEQ
ncbi:MAG TPA: lipoyl(octanoyl) transferase LipB [Blastocatellia bacterium]|nr:lipoyl(octanoyl) transferase LipB [Blastocatellia bacterium]